MFLEIFVSGHYLTSILSKLEYIEVGFTIYLGIIFFKLSITNKYLTILLIIINLLYLATFMSTYIFIQFIFAFSLGLIVYRFSFWGMFLLFGLMLISFYAYNPLKTKMRTHNLIISEQLNFISRLKVLSDSLIYLAGNDKQRKNLEYKYHKHFVLSVSAQANYMFVFKDTHNRHYKMIDDQMIKFIRNYSNDKEDLKNLLNDLQKLDFKITEDHLRIKNALIVPKSVIKKHILNYDSNSYRFFTILNRVDVVSVQRFLVKEYEKGYTGNTLQNLAYLFIPRLLWYDKPIIKNYGVELHNNFYNLNNRNEQNSALGPSFNAEAYWNFGLLGVLGISTFYGLILGLLNNFYNSCNHINAYLSFLLIFIPSIKWIMFFEGWIALTLVGEIIIILIIYLISRLIFAIHKQFFKRCKEN